MAKPKAVRERLVQYGVSEMPATEFKARVAEALEAVAETGATLVVTRHGRAVARVSPAIEPRLSPIGFMAGTVLHARNLVPAAPEDWPDAPDPLNLRP